MGLEVIPAKTEMIKNLTSRIIFYHALVIIFGEKACLQSLVKVLNYKWQLKNRLSEKDTALSGNRRYYLLFTCVSYIK